MSDLQKHVETMIERAAKAQDSQDALRFSQAALNTANTLCQLRMLPPPR